MAKKATCIGVWIFCSWSVVFSGYTSYSGFWVRLADTLYRSAVNVCYHKGHAVSQIIISMATKLQISNTCFVIFSLFLFSSTVCKTKLIDIIVHALHEMVSNFAPQWINGFHFASFFFQIIQNCINETVTISINRCRIKPLLFKTLSNLAVWYFNSMCMATTADEGGLGHLNVDLVFIGVMKILVPCFFLGNFCGYKMVFPLLFHALFLPGSFLYINSDPYYLQIQ